MRLMWILPIALAVLAFAPGMAGGAFAADGDGTGPGGGGTTTETTTETSSPALAGRVDGFVTALADGDDDALAGHVCLAKLRGMALAEGQAMGLVAADADLSTLGRRYDIAYLAKLHEFYDALIAAAAAAATKSGDSTTSETTVQEGDTGILGALEGNAVEAQSTLIQKLQTEIIESADLANGEQATRDADGDPINAVGAVRLTLLGGSAEHDIPALKIVDDWCLNPVSVHLADLPK